MSQSCGGHGTITEKIVPDEEEKFVVKGFTRRNMVAPFGKMETRGSARHLPRLDQRRDDVFERYFDRQ